MKALYNGRSYRSRNWFLRKLGFKSYAHYLRSELWKTVRERVFQVKGRSCYLCGRVATQAHHTRYHEADLKGTKLWNIHPICSGCHQRLEFDGKQKRTFRQAKSDFKRKRQEQVNLTRGKEEIERLSKLLLGYGEKITTRTFWSIPE